MLVCPDSSEVKAIQMLLRKFYSKSSYVPKTAEKDSKKIMKKLNNIKMVDIPKPILKHVNNIFSKVLTT